MSAIILHFAGIFRLQSHPMDYLDAICGIIEIDEPVLLDLTSTQALQRLHGALLLVQRLGGLLEEQIAGQR